MQRSCRAFILPHSEIQKRGLDTISWQACPMYELTLDTAWVLCCRVFLGKRMAPRRAPCSGYSHSHGSPWTTHATSTAQSTGRASCFYAEYISSRIRPFTDNCKRILETWLSVQNEINFQLLKSEEELQFIVCILHSFSFLFYKLVLINSGNKIITSCPDDECRCIPKQVNACI